MEVRNQKSEIRNQKSAIRKHATRNTEYGIRNTKYALLHRRRKLYDKVGLCGRSEGQRASRLRLIAALQVKEHKREAEDDSTNGCEVERGGGSFGIEVVEVKEGCD